MPDYKAKIESDGSPGKASRAITVTVFAPCVHEAEIEIKKRYPNKQLFSLSQAWGGGNNNKRGDESD